MVGQIQVGRIRPHDGHVAWETPFCRVHGADPRSRLGYDASQRLWPTLGLGPRGRVAREAFGLILGGCGRSGTLVGVVAGDASERPAALRIAPAPDPANSLRADPVGVLAVVSSVVPVEDVTIVALLIRDRLGRSGGGVDDRRVGEASRDRREMMCRLGRGTARTRWRGRPSPGRSVRAPRAGK